MADPIDTEQEAREALARFDEPCRSNYAHGYNANGDPLLWRCCLRAGHDGDHGPAVRIHPDDAPRIRALLALLDAERLARQTAERERDEARQYIPAAESCHRLADYMSMNRDLLEYDGCGTAGDEAIRVLGRLAMERDEARAMAPRWVAVDRWFELRVGEAMIGMIRPYVAGTDWAATTTKYPTGDRCGDRESAARAVCARLGLPYIEVPRG